jgi:DNA mismatch endonuclease, patch repair protein
MPGISMRVHRLQSSTAAAKAPGGLPTSDGGLIVDNVTRETRSVLMSRIRGRDTRPELLVRSMVHALGYRFRLHRRDLPGTPDLVFPRLRRVVLVHGCFWHRHEGCRFAYSPKSNLAFWEAKFAGNVRRDRLALEQLQALGWQTLVVWECETRDRQDLERRLASYLGDGKGEK